MAKSKEKPEGPAETPEEAQALTEPDLSTETTTDGSEPTDEAPDASDVDAAQVLANVGDVAIRNAAGAEEGTSVITTDFLNEKGSTETGEWRVGSLAPSTKYLDKDGVSVLDEPRFTDGAGSVLVREGERLTETTLNVIKKSDDAKKSEDK